MSIKFICIIVLHKKIIHRMMVHSVTQDDGQPIIIVVFRGQTWHQKMSTGICGRQSKWMTLMW